MQAAGSSRSLDVLSMRVRVARAWGILGVLALLLPARIIVILAQGIPRGQMVAPLLSGAVAAPFVHLARRIPATQSACDRTVVERRAAEPPREG